eukprot:EG_transcript_30671
MSWVQSANISQSLSYPGNHWLNMVFPDPPPGRIRHQEKGPANRHVNGRLCSPRNAGDVLEVRRHRQRATPGWAADLPDRTVANQRIETLRASMPMLFRLSIPACPPPLGAGKRFPPFSAGLSRVFLPTCLFSFGICRMHCS